MKTAICIFLPQSKNYTFNIDETKLNEGDTIITDSYPNAKIKIISVLKEQFQYVNLKTGELSNDNSSGNFKIKSINSFKKQ